MLELLYIYLFFFVMKKHIFNIDTLYIITTQICNKNATITNKSNKSRPIFITIHFVLTNQMNIFSVRLKLDSNNCFCVQTVGNTATINLLYFNLPWTQLRIFCDNKIHNKNSWNNCGLLVNVMATATDLTVMQGLLSYWL